MLKLADIEDALIADMKASITGLKTCATHEKEFDEQTMQQLKPITPFALVRYGGTNPTESERHADGSSGMNGREFHITVGSVSLRSKSESQRGCYDLLDAMKERYDGFTLSVTGGEVLLSYDGDAHQFSNNGVTVYRIFFKWDEQ